MSKWNVSFEHCSGGDSLLPQANRGFFCDYTVEVEADSEEQAESRGMAAMYAMRDTDHPEWVDRAVDDLAARAEPLA